MIALEKPGSPAEVLEHFGTKGMKWGVRKERSSSSTSSPKTGMSTKKKVAIGVGVTALVIGTAYVGYRLNKSGKLPISSLRSGGKGGGKTFKNIDEAIAAKRKAQGATAAMGTLKSHGSDLVPDPKLLKEHQATLKRLRDQADWSVDWNDVFKKTHGVSASEHPTSLIKWS